MIILNTLITASDKTATIADLVVNIGHFYSYQEAADLLNVSLRTIQRRCHDGKLIYLRVDRGVRIPGAELFRYVKEYLVVGK